MTAFLQMLADLESNKLEVQLVPLNPRLRNYNEGGMKRVCSNKNVAWYRKFCAAHPSSRGTRRGKMDTKIKRQNVLRLLSLLADGKPARSKYAEEIRRIGSRAHP